MVFTSSDELVAGLAGVFELLGGGLRPTASS